MPVIINDFEVVIDPGEISDQGGVEEEAQPQPPAQQPFSPQDVEDIVRRQAERMCRVWAH